GATAQRVLVRSRVLERMGAEHDVAAGEVASQIPRQPGHTGNSLALRRQIRLEPVGRHAELGLEAVSVACRGRESWIAGREARVDEHERSGGGQRVAEKAATSRA